ncbi:glycoside hydrolase family 113 [Segnochrobactraceae bacterium EtOH-i3]
MPSAPCPGQPRSRRRSTLAALGLALLMAGSGASAETIRPVREDGVNLIQDDAHPYGSADARTVLMQLAADGAKVVALVPFLWQPKPDSTDIVRGRDMADDQLRAGIRTARMAGLKVMVKPHIWVPERWAGSVVMSSDADWSAWFARYKDEVVRLARIAAEEKAEFFSIGTEVAQSTERPEWSDVIAAVRAVYPGRLTYSAHWAEEVERFPFWDRLDAIGVTLYPALGTDNDPLAWRAGMKGEIDRVIAVADRVGKPVWITEIGLRSAEGAAEKPWESAEEREAPPDGDLQSDVLAVWYEMLDRPEIEQILIWRWITDPKAGGATDTDFTVQNKPAQSLLTCLWENRCSPAAPRFSERLQAILAARPTPAAPASGPAEAPPAAASGSSPETPPAATAPAGSPGATPAEQEPAAASGPAAGPSSDTAQPGAMGTAPPSPGPAPAAPPEASPPHAPAPETPSPSPSAAPAAAPADSPPPSDGEPAPAEVSPAPSAPTASAPASAPPPAHERDEAPATPPGPDSPSSPSDSGPLAPDATAPPADPSTARP